LKYALDIIDLKLVGINVIVMKEEYRNKMVILIPFI
jgi:hypothetical protein